MTENRRLSPTTSSLRRPAGRKRACTRALGLLVALSGCADLPGADAPEDAELAESDEALYRTGTTFGRSVPVCWSAASAQRADFNQWNQRTQAAVMRSWTQASGVRFTGWGVCPAIPMATIRITLDNSTHANSYVGYFPLWATEMNLGTQRTDFDVAAMHEFGHALGYQHEMVRPDFARDPSGGCTEGVVNGGDSVNTPADRDSIMASTGYCQDNLVLSAWDVVGVQTSYGRPNYFADVSGDGRADAIVTDRTGVTVRTSDGATFPGSTQRNWSNGAYFGQKGSAFADVNGDGRADAIAVNDDGIYVRLSADDAFPLWAQSRATDEAFYGNLGTYFADVTGDGRADAIAINADGTYVRSSAGSSFPLSTQSKWSTSLRGELGSFFADVNGDGRADAIAVHRSGVQVRLSLGNTFASPTAWTSVPYFGDRGTFFADVTGDGRADAIVVNSDGVTVRASNGSSFPTPSLWISHAYYGERGIMFADTNGDRRADAIVVNENGVFVSLSTGSGFTSSAGNWTGVGYYALN